MSTAHLTDAEKTPVYLQPGCLLEDRIEDLLGRMTLEEKVAQLRSELADHPLYVKQGAQVDLSDDLRKALTGVAFGKIGLLLRADPWTGLTYEAALTPRQGSELVNRIQRHICENTRLGIPILIGNDGNHGHLGRQATIFPALCALGCTWDRGLAERVGRVIALESRSRGETVIYAPDLDVIRDPRVGRSDQNFGEDPYHVGQMGAAMVRGLQGENLAGSGSVVALLRAYPGVGDAEGGHDFGQTSCGPIEMAEVVLRPWEDAVRAGAEGVMVELAVYDGIPVSRSHQLLTGMLRDRWGFQGFTMGDTQVVGYLVRCRTEPGNKAAAVTALKAGLDMNLPDAVIEADVLGKQDHVAYGLLVKAVREGLVSEVEVDRAVRHILRVKFLLGLFENPFTDPNAAEAVARCSEHGQLALEAARKGIVLLKNKGPVLPLGSCVSSIAVVGPNADDDWVQLGDYAPAHSREDVVTILQGICARAGEGCKIYYARGCGIRNLSKEGFAEALEAARQSDIVVAVVGGSSKLDYVEGTNGKRSEEADCGEAVDRADLNLSGVQEDLLMALQETGKPLVVVLVHGRPASIPWAVEHAEAIMDAGYPGEAGGIAVAEVLFGDYNPGGRLTVSVPRHVGQLPVYYYSRFPSRTGYVEMDAEPLYPFGYGLGYTTFAYRNLTVTPKTITAQQSAHVAVEVTNTGRMAGDEVVQLYIRDELCSVMRPWKQLKGFERVRIEPGQSKAVTFEVGWEELCFYDGQAWTVEPGEFTLIIGRNAYEDLLCATLNVVGS